MRCCLSASVSAWLIGFCPPLESKDQLLYLPQWYSKGCGDARIQRVSRSPATVEIRSDLLRAHHGQSFLELIEEEIPLAVLFDIRPRLYIQAHDLRRLAALDRRPRRQARPIGIAFLDEVGKVRLHRLRHPVIFWRPGIDLIRIEIAERVFDLSR